MKNKQKVVSILVGVSGLIFLASCGGGGSGGSNDKGEDSLLSGYFLDSAVEGMEYVTLVQTGENTFTTTRAPALTTKSGKFKYKAGEFIRFTIGNLGIGMVPGKTKVTPLDFTSEISADHSLNIARFLQTLDNDNNLTNGITITDAVRNQAATYTSHPGFNFGFETGILPIVDELTSLTDAGTRSLIDANSALVHMNNTFNSSRPGDFPFVYGVYSGTYSIDVSNCSDPADDGIYDFTVELSINNQNQSSINGTAVGTINFMGDTFHENISLSGSISMTGEVTGTTTHTFVDSGGEGTFNGQLNGDTLTIVNSGADTFGDTCSYSRNITVSR